MEWFFVLAVAVGVGVFVYRLTAGGELDAEPGLPATGDPEPDAGPTSEPRAERTLEAPEGYIPVSPGGPSWHARLGGAMGLVIAVAVGAIALAFSLWALTSFVARLVSDAGGGAPAT
ncbi:MAG: hypothetical protein OEV60_09875 [Actinomycetota bacterium]|nr:hypothetical protein [Actinomycetota bacterium]MDH5225603.1 hypothetical protein [Actinomycetota bacterium]MDH5313561.1 hypothetical protein [Actinomycetota bacterium]